MGITVGGGVGVGDGDAVAVARAVDVSENDAVGVLVAVAVAVGRITVSVGFGVGVSRVGAGVGVSVLMHPTSELPTAATRHAMPTPGCKQSTPGQALTGLVPSAIPTPVMSSSMVTSPSPLQSPTQGVWALAVAGVCRIQRPARTTMTGPSLFHIAVPP